MSEQQDDADLVRLTVRDAILKLHQRIMELERVADIHQRQLQFAHKAIEGHQRLIVAIAKLAGAELVIEPAPEPPPETEPQGIN